MKEMRKSLGRQYEIDMCNGTMADKILLFAIPLMLSSLLQLLFNAADVVVVGRYAGKEALAAVGANTALINLMVNFFIGLSVGTNVVVARDIGAGKMDQINRSVHTTITLALISGTGLLVFGNVAARFLLELMKTPADVIDLAIIYLRIYFLGMPANMVYNFGAAILRARGDTQRPLFFLTLAGIINVVLNLFFVIAFHMSVAGVALATIISQYISAVLVLRCLMKETGALRLELKKLRMEWPVIRRIMQIGVPSGLNSVIFAFANVVVQGAVNSFDNADLVAGSTTSNNIEGFVYAAIHAFVQAALTFASQNYGAGECKRVDRSMRWCLLFGVLAGMIVGGFAGLFGEELAALYAPGEEEVISWAVLRIRYIAVPYFLCACMDVPVGAMRGIGYSVASMLSSLVGACGFRLLWIATVFQVYHTPQCLFMAYAVSWSLTALINNVLFFILSKKAYAKVEEARIGE